ncbi:MAG: FAD binding domain-containing protein [Spirochaetaceae bacterium]|nr:MAG: FAD binding domain-containing protein [Spirochaetaceae bacterium]
MAAIQWYFPSELDEVPEILTQEGVIPHSGGTGILWGGLTRVRGLMDVSRLDLRFVRKRDGALTLGAALSYRQTVEALAVKGQILAQSLHCAATEPLRNRITLGGSISMFPYWSDLMGPLLALEAELSLVGATSGIRPLSEYVTNRKLRQNTLITSIRLSDASWQGTYYRHTRTPTDRPAFSITVLMRRNSKRIEAIRIVVIGCRGRFRRLTEIENALNGAPIPGDPAELIATASGKLNFDFPARMGFSAEYLKACALIELERTLGSALGSTQRDPS